ncbi:hypothetical protein HH308_05050 [Gordonia sp. TBRC 11910]|uniref:Uncharacterized protein n=1 Tax=Gordonia asplenii TaxID=2725283 RepID=A0A848KWM8_9ACTN|nr:hypothetical protein [Gordonia asplenii]NMO00581.1 hypothetical protein [Gordonia asplenii]
MPPLLITLSVDLGLESGPDTMNLKCLNKVGMIGGDRVTFLRAAESLGQHLGTFAQRSTPVDGSVDPASLIGE